MPITRVKDVARVELGSKMYKYDATSNGKPCAALAIYQLPGANALQVASSVGKGAEPYFSAGGAYSVDAGIIGRLTGVEIMPSGRTCTVVEISGLRQTNTSSVSPGPIR